MTRFLLHSIGLLAVAGCAGFGPSDPLEGVPRLSDVEISDAADAANIVAPESQPGFFAGLFGGGTEPDEPAPETEPASAPAGGLFGRIFGGGGNAVPQAPGSEETEAAIPPDAIPPGTLLPFGEVGRTCGMQASALGKEIYAASGYTIFDSNPGTTEARPHYVIGFQDGCARQFTAALVLNGDVGTHEIVRYQTAQSRLPYTEVDEAYETLKAQVCGASRGRSCGARLNQLARNTTFITGYARFTSSPEWVELLLHDGAVLAVGVERK